MENHHFSWENPLLMAIFNSYLTLPEVISMIFSSAETQARPSIATVRGRVLGGFGKSPQKPWWM